MPDAAVFVYGGRLSRPQRAANRHLSYSKPANNFFKMRVVAHGGGGSILVVDDEEIDLASYHRALEHAGYSVLTAANFNGAVDAFKKAKTEIVLLLVDVSIPYRNGVELARELLRLKPELKVLFMSGMVGAEVIRRYGRPEADRHFMQKPFGAPELVQRVKEILDSGEQLNWLAANAW